MMPEAGEISIAYAPETTDGFRLGLSEDFGIAAEKHDPRYDDTAQQMLDDFFRSFGRHDYELERYLDFGLCANSISRLFKQSLNVIEL